MKTMIPPGRRSMTFLFALFGASCAATAQTVTASSTPASVKEEVLELSPFEVNTSRDVGYVATSALAGSRTDTPLKETPVAISVMTREFIDDIAASSFAQASEWALNAAPVPVSGDESITGGYSVRFRGLSTSNPSRNYFLWYVDSDNYNTERLEYSRGPNGVLFGDGNVGGISTIWTKRAQLGANKTVMATSADTYGGYRATLDVMRTLNKRVALRLNLLTDTVAQWRDARDWERYGAHLAGVVKIDDRSQFRFEGEYGQYNRFTFATNYQDQVSFWDGTTYYNGTTTPPTGRGIGRVSSNAWFLDVPALGNLIGYASWSTTYQTNGTTVAIEPEARTDIARSPALPNREFNMQPRDTGVESPFYSYSFYLDRRFGEDFFVELGFNQSLAERVMPINQTLFRAYRIDVNQLLPNGVPNPKVGVPFIDATRSRRATDDFSRELRMMATWRHNFSFFTQKLNAILGYREAKFYDLQEDVRRSNGPNPDLTSAENTYRMRVYADQPGAYLSGGLPSFPGYEFAWYRGSAGTDQDTRLGYAQMVSSSQFLKNRLNVLAGARYDQFDRSLAVMDGPADPVTRLLTFGPKRSSKSSPTSLTGGAVYFIKPWLGIYGNYSETFAVPNSGPNLLDGSAPGISRSTGYDMGLKLQLFEDRVSATFNYYDSEQADQLQAANGRRTEINRIWTNLGRSDTVDYRDTMDFVGKGYEFEITANPTRNLRLTANYAIPETATVNQSPGLRAYYAANLATWQAGANDLSNPNRNQIAADITTLANTLAEQAPGAVLNSTFDYTANAYATYSWRTGWLKNVSLGGGANFRGKNKIGAGAGGPFDYIKAGDYVVASAHLGYRFKVGKVSTRLQLNVSNLFDNDDVQYLSVVSYRVGGLAANPLVYTPGTFRYLEPRRYKLTATFEF